jgi:hypothetical protein
MRADWCCKLLKLLINAAYCMQTATPCLQHCFKRVLSTPKKLLFMQLFSYIYGLYTMNLHLHCLTKLCAKPLTPNLFHLHPFWGHSLPAAITYRAAQTPQLSPYYFLALPLHRPACTSGHVAAQPDLHLWLLPVRGQPVHATRKVCR